jgi:hypothetical protein
MYLRTSLAHFTSPPTSPFFFLTLRDEDKWSLFVEEEGPGRTNSVDSCSNSDISRRNKFDRRSASEDDVDDVDESATLLPRTTAAVVSLPTAASAMEEEDVVMIIWIERRLNTPNTKKMIGLQFGGTLEKFYHKKCRKTFPAD